MISSCEPVVLLRKEDGQTFIMAHIYLLYPTSMCFIYKRADGLVSVLSLWCSCWKNMIDFGMWERKTVVFIPQERDCIVLCEQNPIWPRPYRWPVMATASDSVDE